MLYCIVLHCIALYCYAVLHCVALRCVVLELCCAVLCCVVLYCIVLYCVVWCGVVLYCFVHYCSSIESMVGSSKFQTLHIFKPICSSYCYEIFKKRSSLEFGFEFLQLNIDCVSEENCFQTRFPDFCGWSRQCSNRRNVQLC